MSAPLTENAFRAAMAVGKKIVVLAEEEDYELCIPEGGIRPKDSFWRKKMQTISPLVAIVRMSAPSIVRESAAKLAPESEMIGPVVEEPKLEPVVGAPESEPSHVKIAEPINSSSRLSPLRSDLARSSQGSIKLRLLHKNAPNTGLERDEKICIDCELPYPRDAFYTNSSAKDGRQSRCKECDNRRRAEHNQGLHVRASEKADFDREVARKRALEVVASVPAPPGKTSPYVYKGVSGGFLIYGYVR